MKFRAGFAVIARRKKAVGSDQHAIRIEAGIQSLRRAEAADKQAGTDEQKERKRNLRDDENAREARAMESAGNAARILFQHGNWREIGSAPGREHAENNSGEEGEQHGGEQHAVV